MKTQLILLDTPIIVSTEKIKVNEMCYDTESKTTYKSKGNIPANEYVLKVIAGPPNLPKIDWNGLESEFGYVDVEELADIWSINTENVHPADSYIAKAGFIQGFKTAQKLNDKKFSLEDMFKAFKFYAFASLSQQPYNQEELDEHFENFIQSLSKFKVFDIEIEMENCNDCIKLQGQNLNPDCCHQYQPKITNNSIKILKKL